MKKFFIFISLCLCMTSCKEYYSEGERVGTVIQFSETGVILPSWEGQLNLTQTGMNTSGEPFEFSFDRHRNDQMDLIELVSDAQCHGWKLKMKYHEVWGFKNCFRVRGETNYFIDEVSVIDSTFAKPLGNIEKKDSTFVLGTKDNPLYVVIVK